MIKELLHSWNYSQVSLRPTSSSLKLGSGSSRHTSTGKSSSEVEPKESGVLSHSPRTRDDSSDEEEFTHGNVKEGQG